MLSCKVGEETSLGDIRFQFVKAMLEEFPGLRSRIKEHLRNTYPTEVKGTPHETPVSLSGR